ncbi:MAG: Com family DNA-binding transcriptional regulator [Lachnospiraceae bacterium]|nr:Com family DNA-binding transcriptional regulator [Lachnospiraceae bacterium]
MEIEKIKCARCGRTLMLADYVKGEIKCPRCGEINQLDYRQGQEPKSRTSE